MGIPISAFTEVPKELCKLENVESNRFIEKCQLGPYIFMIYIKVAKYYGNQSQKEATTAAFYIYIKKTLVNISYFIL